MGVSEGREEVGDKRSMEERGATGNRKKEGDGKREKRGEVEIGVGEGEGRGRGRREDWGRGEEKKKERWERKVLMEEGKGEANFILMSFQLVIVRLWRRKYLNNQKV